MDTRKALVAAIAIAGAAAIATVAIVSRGGSDEATATTLGDTRGVAVSGTGTVAIKPDTAFIDVGVQSTAATVEEARARAADAMTKVIDALKANGVNETDIQTTSFSINPQYDYPPNASPTLRGYMVANTVSAKIKGEPGAIGDIAGKVIDAAAKAAGDLATVNGVRFTIDDPSAAVSDARKKAMDDAKAKAEQLARLAGVNLGDPIVITEGASFNDPYVYATRNANAAPAPDEGTPIQAGRLDVSVNVSVTYAIN